MRREVDPQLDHQAGPENGADGATGPGNPGIDPRLEAVARHQLTRLIDAIETTPAEVAAFEAPAARQRARARAASRRRRTLALSATGIVAAAAAVLAFVVLPGDGDDRIGDVTTDMGRRTTTTTSPTTTTAPSTSTSATTATTDPAAPEGPTGSDCSPDGAGDGVALSGALPGGGTWEYRVTGALPNVRAEVRVDGSPTGDGTLGAESQQEALAPDRLVWGHVVRVDGGEVADFVVPGAATGVEAHVWDGYRREVVELCTEALATGDALRYAALFTPSGSEVIAVVATDAGGAAVAHSDLVTIPDRGGPEAMDEVLSGDLPSGRWTFRAGGDAELLAVQLDLPSGSSGSSGGSGSGEGGGSAGAAVRSRPELLRDTWYASSVWDGSAGRYFLWGFTRSDVTEVVLTLYDGQIVRIPTLSPGGTGAGGRVFAGEFPAGPGIRLVEGHRADGSVAVELPDPENGSIGNGMSEQENVRIPMHELP